MCAECHDLDRGAISVEVRREGELFIWRDFVLEVAYTPERTQDAVLRACGPLAVDAQAYIATLRAVPPPLIIASPCLH